MGGTRRHSSFGVVFCLADAAGAGGPHAGTQVQDVASKTGGMLSQLEEKIIDMVAQSIAQTEKVFAGDFKISFNITGKSLFWDIESCIDNALKKYKIPAERMWIEITEQDVISKSDEVVGTLRRLKAKGHTLLIDDFGMGHTSLLYLQSGFFGVVKLDGSLVRNIVHSETNRNIEILLLRSETSLE